MYIHTVRNSFVYTYCIYIYIYIYKNTRDKSDIVTKKVHILSELTLALCTRWLCLQVAWFLEVFNYFSLSWKLVHHGQSAALCVHTALFDVLTTAGNEYHFLMYNVATLFNFPLCHTLNPKLKYQVVGISSV